MRNRTSYKVHGALGRRILPRITGPAGGEKKFSDKLIDFFAANMLDTLTDANSDKEAVIIPQDATQNGRIGRKVMLTGLRFRGQVRWNTHVARPAQNWDHKVRVLLFVDHQNNKSTSSPLFGDLFNLSAFSVPPGPPLNTNWMFYYNLENQNRFTVLYDKVHYMGPTSAVGTTAAADTIALGRQATVPDSLAAPVRHSRCYPYLTNTPSVFGKYRCACVSLPHSVVENQQERVPAFGVHRPRRSVRQPNVQLH